MPKKIKIKGQIVPTNYGRFFDWIGWESAYPGRLESELAEAEGEDIILEINSPGGYVSAGFDMYNAIQGYEGKVTAHIVTAASAATVIACAADETLMSDTGYFMIHNSRTVAAGTKKDMNQTINALDSIDESIINAYQRKTGKSREELAELMDNETYMSPQKAIEMGFAEGFIHGDPQALEGAVAAGAEVPVIAKEKMDAIMSFLDSMEKSSVAPVQQEMQKIGVEAVSDTTTNTKGEKKMTLKELLANDPEASAEYDAAITDARNEARAEGIKAERDRIQSLDAVSKAVTAEALNDAKYGENPIDGPTLAYQAMVNGEKMAKAYMEQAITDSQNSGSQEVGIGNPDAGEEATDESEELASYINSMRR